jgi:hypothetical protein
LLLRLFWVLPAIVLAIGCGKKGPPLAPIIRIPAAIDKIQAQRAGGDAFITLTVPDKNIDTSIPVDIGRIEVYGYTGRMPPPRTRWVEFGELIATIPVVPLPIDVPPGTDTAPPPEPGGVTPKGATPGMIITVLDTLTGPKLVQGRIEEPLPARRGRAPLTPVVTTPQPDVLRRFYVAFAFSTRGRPGPPGTAAEFPLVDAPAPPAFVRTPYTEASVVIEWPPSGGLLGYLFDHPMAQEDVPLDASGEPIVTTPVRVPGPAPAVAAAVTAAVTIPAGPVHYNLYREVGPDPLAPPDEIAPTPWNMTRRAPLNAAPLDVMTFTDPVEFDRERCYVVRAFRGVAPNVIEGDASEPACVTPTDIFPPAPPARLVAVADEGGISLIWEPNGEPDLAGYLVLRGEASDATLQTLTPTPIVEPRFRDTHTISGKKYVYAVVALDSHLPVPNVSAESARVEETAR